MNNTNEHQKKKKILAVVIVISAVVLIIASAAAAVIIKGRDKKEDKREYKKYSVSEEENSVAETEKVTVTETTAAAVQETTTAAREVTTKVPYSVPAAPKAPIPDPDRLFGNQSSECYTVIKDGFIEVKKGPGNNFATVKKIECGSDVEVRGIYKSWAYIENDMGPSGFYYGFEPKYVGGWTEAENLEKHITEPAGGFEEENGTYADEGSCEEERTYEGSQLEVNGEIINLPPDRFVREEERDKEHQTFG